MECLPRPLMVINFNPKTSARCQQHIMELLAALGAPLLRYGRPTLRTNLNLCEFGVVGLGIGTLAAYGRPGDYFRFYEINPEVTRIAYDQRFFTFLSDSQATLEVIAGDARLSMESELQQDRAQFLTFL
jgi:hypothetical protein